MHLLAASLDLPASAIGAKAAGLVALLRLGLPVPPGLVIETAACRQFLSDGRLPDGLAEAAARVAGPGGLVSVRSGAAVSMPGMMNTLLNVPVSDVPAAVAEVFASWHTPRAVTYRELHGIDHNLGTAVIVQAMVFGDSNDASGTGVAFSRDPRTGARTVFGEMLYGHQGDAVVAGESTTLPLTALPPAVFADLAATLDRLEHHYRDVCQVEFTFEAAPVTPTGSSGAPSSGPSGAPSSGPPVAPSSGPPAAPDSGPSPATNSRPTAPARLWFLQVRPGGLVGRAAVRVAVDLVDERVISPAEAVERVTARDVRLARAPRISDPADAAVVVRGQGASPGVATGRVAVTADNAARMARSGPVVLFRPHTSPLDMHGLAAAAGVVTSRGGPTSHAAVVARSMGKPAVVAATALVVDESARCIRVGDRVTPEGDLVTIDGAGGEVVAGEAPTVTGEDDPHLKRLLAWWG